MWRPLISLIGPVACSAAAVGCGHGHVSETGVSTPKGAQDAAVQDLSTSLKRQTQADHLAGPKDVRCVAVAHTQGRPQGKQYDFQCIATFPNGREMGCTVPADSGGSSECTPALEAESPYPAIYQTKTS
jgi:hypothetical protein